MTKYSTKKALISSIVVLALCFTMLIGTTFAWFTDSASSVGNVIKTGNLDVEMYYADGTEAVPTTAEGWTNVTTGGPIFNYTNWEPGYAQVRHVKIENKGSLAIKYKVLIVADGEVSDLADVIDVYYVDPAVQVETADDLVNTTKLGTLTDVLSNIGATGNGSLVAGDSDVITLALVMQESAGNEYMNKSIGAEFTVQVLATQYTSEDDSFGDQYDADAEYPVVPVYPVNTSEELRNRLENAVPGEDIFVGAGEFVISSALSIPSGVNLYGAQAGVPAYEWINYDETELTVIKYTGTSGGTVLDIYQSSTDVDEAVKNIKIDGILVNCNNTAEKGIKTRKVSGSEAIENVTIVNCAVVNSTNDGIDVGNCYGAVIENNYVKDVVDNAIRLGNYNGYHWDTWEEVTAYVCNNVIENVTKTEDGAIMLENGMGDVVVSGNVIKNVNSGNAQYSSSVKASAITVYDVYEGGEIVIENNTIENVNQGIAIYKYTYSNVYGEDWWAGPTTDNDGVVVSGNTITGYNVFAIATSNLNYAGNNSNTTVVEITNNTITGGAAEKAIKVGTEKSGWKVVLDNETIAQ